MRFQVEELNNRDCCEYPSIIVSHRVRDNKLDRTVCYCKTHADATLIAQALELQEVKTLKQMKLDYGDESTGRLQAEADADYKKKGE